MKSEERNEDCIDNRHDGRKSCCTPLTSVLCGLLILAVCALLVSVIILIYRTNHFVSAESKSRRLNKHLTRSGKEANIQRGSMWITRIFSSVNKTTDEETVDINEVYSRWSKWSKCRIRKCKQIRKRYCAVPSVCGDKILKEERPCRRKMRCTQQVTTVDNKKFHIVKKRRLSKRLTGGLRFHKAFYTKWTKWLPCSPLCRTERMRKCKFSHICGNNSIKEEGLCYEEGSQCENWYREGKDLLEDEDDLLNRLSRDESSSSFIAEEELRRQEDSYILEVPEEDLSGGWPKCGRRKSRRLSTPSWALRIIGGREAPKGRWPWQVAILNKYKEVYCGGTWMGNGWILTAAHCVRKHFYVRLGEHDIIVKEGTEMEFSVSESILHPDYNPDTVDNDVALLRIPIKNLDTDFEVPCLPEQGDPIPINKYCTIVGWGKEKNSHIFGTDVLHEAQIPIVSQKECLNVYKEYYITDNMFCAGFKQGRIDSCAGDSGGPLLCEDSGSWTIQGITSFGEGCGRKGKYGIYAKVSNYSDWIKKVIGSLD